MSKFIQIVDIKGDKYLLNIDSILKIYPDNSIVVLLIQHNDGTGEEIYVSDSFDAFSSALGAIKTQD